MMISKMLRNVCVIAVLAGISGVASADTLLGTFSFTTKVTNNTAYDGSAFKVELWQDDGYSAASPTGRFVFTNNYDGDPSFSPKIMEIYFYDGDFIKTDNVALNVVDGTVDAEFFEAPNLNSGLPGFDERTATKVLQADLLSNGRGDPIDPGDSFAVVFNLKNDIGFVKAGLENQAFQIGIHVGGLPDRNNGDDSDSFMNNPEPDPAEPVTVPLPATVWAGMVLLGGLGLMKIHGRRRWIA